MRTPIPVVEIALAVMFISRSLTRIYQQRAIERDGAAGARAAAIPGSGVIPAWVSFLAVAGWFTTLAAAAALVVG